MKQYSLERLKHPVKKILCYSHWLAKAWHTRDMNSSAGRRCHSLEAIRHCIYWQHGEPTDDRCSLNSRSLPHWCGTGNPWIYPWMKNSPPTRNCQTISRKSLCTFLISIPLYLCSIMDSAHNIHTLHQPVPGRGSKQLELTCNFLQQPLLLHTPGFTANNWAEKQPQASSSSTIQWVYILENFS